MSELFYKSVRLVGGAIFRIASAPKILHAERARLPGPWLLAANHTSAFDAPLLIAATPRVIYWLSIAEIFRNPFARWFLTAVGASPLDRSKVDTATVRTIVRHLRAGRVVGLFPEGGVRVGGESVLRSGGINDGVCKLAQLARVPVLPCVILGGEKFARWTSWLPFARTRWAVAFGEPVFPHETPDRTTARAAMAQEIIRSLRTLHAEAARHV
jgi:1-acyl-sn-glycerol-3-phosphate acyltransferase